MELITLDKVKTESGSQRFKQSVLHILIWVCLLLSLLCFLLWQLFIGETPIEGKVIIMISIPVILLFFLCILNDLKCSLAKTNWMIVLCLKCIYVKYRPYTNIDSPTNNLQVLLLRLAEIRSVNIVKQKIKSYGSGNSRSISYHTYLDINTTGVDLGILKQKLKKERELTSFGKVGFIKVSTKHSLCPVSVVDSGTIRIAWRSPKQTVTPRAKRAITAFEEKGVLVGDIVREVIDMTGIDKKNQKELEDKILYMAERGNIMAAIKLVRRTYKMDLADAKAFVEELSK